MNKGKIARLVGFVAALGMSAALVAVAVSSTGAYFTASQAGTLSGTTGQITIGATGSTDLSFSGLIPGVYQDKSINYTVDGNSSVDTWLVFNDDAAYRQFTGGKGDPAATDGGMGRYGHFALKDNAGNLLFSSYNLANSEYVSASIGGVSECANSDGHCVAPEATGINDTTNRMGVPLAIKLESSLAATSNRTVSVTFGITPRATGQNVPAPSSTVGFKIVATQPGIAPTAKGF